MVDVTKSNFAEQFLIVKDAIDECDFVAIDTELTGLYNTCSTEHAFDTMEEKYSKIRKECSNLLIIQFGLSTFKYHPEQKKYTHGDFNFYIFPGPPFRQAKNPIHAFICQTASLHFLASNGFDFNKVIYEGIPYLTRIQEARLRDSLSSKHKVGRDSSSQDEVDDPDEHKQTIDDINLRVDSFIVDESSDSSYRGKQKHTIDDEMYTDRDKLENSKETSDVEDIDSAVGFRKVMDYLSRSKKLIVGHCIYLDILHMMEQFYLPLPEALKDYKSMVRMTFPRLLDTKYLASSEKLRPFFDGTSLSALFQQLQGNAFEIPVIEAGDKCYDQDSNKYHEAGYDAFMAGVCFIGMAKKLGSLASPSIEYVDPSSKLLAPYCNRFHILRHYDITCLNISGPDPEPNRDNVFHVSFPAEWKTVDLVELFLPYGDIYVHWLDDVSALVALRNPSNSLSAKVRLVNKFSRIYRVKPFAEYQKGGRQQSTSSKEVATVPCPAPNSIVIKKRNSGSTEGLASCSMDLIPEGDESEAQVDDRSAGSQPPAKRLKPFEEPEPVEVSSTAAVFEEDNNW